MPVYNGSRYLKQSIESVLNQSFSDFQFVIIDDKSKDNSLEIITFYAKQDPRINTIRNKKNSGIQKSLNSGIANAEGEYIARIDHDDIWCDKDKLKKQIDFLEQNTSHALIGTAAILINESDHEIGRAEYQKNDKDIRKKLLISNQFAHPSILIRKKALEKVGFYSEEKGYRHVEDYELWLRLGKKYKIANLSDYSLKYRVNPEGVSLKNQFRQRLAGLKLSIKYSKYYPSSFRAILIKIFALSMSRSIIDSITKNSLAKKGYTKLTGIRK